MAKTDQARASILGRLRQAQTPFQDIQQPDKQLDVQPMLDTDNETLLARFKEEAEKLDAKVAITDKAGAIAYVLDVMGDDKRVMCWDGLPVHGLSGALQEADIVQSNENDVRVGITGVDGAFASTGSIVLMASPEQPRQPSLLPLVHVALIKQEQIVPNFEAWAQLQRQDQLTTFRQSGNINIITGASRTADIGMELVLGAHGPSTLHLVVVRHKS
jgi:L-lactate dehydrogenase complex protein LldG